MKRIAIVAAIAVVLTGCGPEPTMGMGATGTVPNSWESNPRFSVSRVGVFKDDIAYNSRRGIYIVIDNKTGQEFIGVSGVGIAELGSHSVGKGSAPDER